jgi:predicted GIY-YIG superfamily endonuclease
MEETFLYIGHYTDRNGNYILKLGTTNNLDRRQKEHNRNYKKATTHTMREDSAFEYDWWRALDTKYDALAFEDDNRDLWKEENFGKYMRQDRFVCDKKPRKVKIYLEDVYEITL